MHGMSMDGGIGWLLLVVLWIIPAWKILDRMGMTPALSLLAALPFLGFLILLFIVANSPWPKFNGSGKA